MQTKVRRKKKLTNVVNCIKCKYKNKFEITKQNKNKINERITKK